MSSFRVLTKKCQETTVTVVAEPCWVVWFSADELVQLLRLPPSCVLQSIPPRHRKCFGDFRGQLACRFDSNKVFIDLFGLSVLCSRSNCNVCDYLLTCFVAEIYQELACFDRRRSSGCRRRSSGFRRRSSGCRRRSSGQRRRSSRRRSSCSRRRRSSSRCHKHHRETVELLERLVKQSDQIIKQNETNGNNITQLTVNTTSQFLEVNNTLAAIRAQNVNILNQIANILDILDTRLNDISERLELLIVGLETRLNGAITNLTDIVNRLQDTLRIEITALNSVIANLAASIGNMISTLNNIAQTLAGLNLDAILNLLSGLVEKIDAILDILTPLTKKGNFA
ncbi:calyx [Leucania separata nucleopolyhedrovirus]|uniref:Calyx n=1 Tax=Leucania separata nucleopolyhedrovirus TaxID=1307956 RepID=Q0IKW1_NPVLS|nr:calyx [Leucania separata nucleopolyhedrovirus]AAR28922.1 calyx [Leucania separata nucleopolyhedrovirus]